MRLLLYSLTYLASLFIMSDAYMNMNIYTMNINHSTTSIGS